MNKNGNYLIPASVLFSALIVALALVYRAGIPTDLNRVGGGNLDLSSLKIKMVQAGVINETKFELASTTLNLLWALGLSNKNPILEKGPMTDPSYGGADRFASTGGWTLSVGNAMSHYSMHNFIGLTAEQQALVERVSKNIFRPCCGNSAYFPDCNHGMAMLGLLELMASRGSGEEEMYDEALKANISWFPDMYANIEAYLAQQGKNIGLPAGGASAKEVLSAEFSSAAGYQRVVEALKPAQDSGSSCGV